MGFLTPEDNPIMLQTIKDVQEESKLDIDEYTKFKKPLTGIQSFYADKSIFLTGATGFLGICFVEKVLRDCSDIKNLYLLVRTKNGVSIQDKMKKYFSNIAFNRLRKINPNFESKVIAVTGDLCEKNLGLSAEDRQMLIDNVDIIVHNGATVKFYERISVALRINVLSTKDMLDLALDCKHVKAFVYVSTAYSHSYKKIIQEEFYEPPVDLKIVHDMIAADQAAKHGLSEEVAKAFFDKWVNIYTFSKSISEDLVRQYGEKASFACSVYRPSMVISAYKEPLIGWIGNKNGPTTLLLGGVLGLFHVVYDKNENEPFDTVPVDYSINALIASIYDAANQRKNESRPRVYNFASSTANPISVKRYYDYSRALVPSIGLKNAVMYQSAIFTYNKLLFYVLHFFFHCIPAVFVDIALLAMGKKTRALRMCIPITMNLHWLMHFMSFGWLIQVTEMRKVYDRLSESDQKLFDFNIWNLNWEEYCSRYIIGMRSFLLDEPFDNIEETKKYHVFLRNVHYITLTLFYIIVGYYLMKFLNIFEIVKTTNATIMHS